MNVKKFGSRKLYIKKKSKPAKKLGPKNWVKIGSVTAEIFLIWTNVARTNVAWSNVTAIIEICSR